MMNEKDYLAGYRAGVEAGVIHCHDCVYRWQLENPQRVETDGNESFCYKHSCMTAASYFCGDAKR